MTLEDKRSYPQGPIQEPGKIDGLLEQYPHLYADLSAQSGYNALSRDRDLTRRFLGKHHRKLLFGTDRFVQEEDPLIIDLVRGLDLPRDQEDAIFTKNAERLLRL